MVSSHRLLPPLFLSKRAQQISDRSVSIKMAPPSPPVDGPIVGREAQITATLHTLPVIKSEQTNDTVRFRSAQELLKHVTKNWQSNFVTLDLRTRKSIELFIKRPFFMLLSLDGPLHQRFLRSKRYISSWAQYNNISNPIYQVYRSPFLYKRTTLSCSGTHRKRRTIHPPFAVLVIWSMFTSLIRFKTSPNFMHTSTLSISLILKTYAQDGIATSWLGFLVQLYIYQTHKYILGTCLSCFSEVKLYETKGRGCPCT